MQVTDWNLNSKLVSVGDRNTPAMEINPISFAQGLRKRGLVHASTWFAQNRLNSTLNATYTLTSG